LKPWASLNYEKELGDIGPRTYARVCELILRLKGNMMAPAMHSCTGAFYTHPESKEVVDGEPVEVLEYLPREWSTEWKANVLRNGMEFKRKFAVDPSLGSHTLTFTTGDPGMIVQRAIIDWGGLKPTYVGPEVDSETGGLTQQ